MTERNLNCPDCRRSTAPCGRHGSFVMTPYVPAMLDLVLTDSVTIIPMPPVDLGAFVENYIASGEYWDFDATYDAEEGWELIMLGGPESCVVGRGATLAEAVAELAESAEAARSEAAGD